MEIRAFKPEDVEEARRIFDKFYSHDKVGGISFPDFAKDYFCAFTVLNSKGDVITAGGIRTIAEACLITDKDRSARERVLALQEVIRVAAFIARDFKFDWIHAITDDPTWANQMKEYGFVERGIDLEIDVRGIR